MKASPLSSCTHEKTPGVAANVGGREVVRQALVAAAEPHGSPEDPILRSAIGAFASLLHYSSPPSTIVLRI